MANLPPILTTRPAVLDGKASVLRLFIDGVCPLFLNEDAGRATFAMPDVPGHVTRMIFDPFGTPVYLPFTGHLELTVSRSGGAPASLNTFVSTDDRNFANIIDIESQLHAAPLPPTRATVPASLKITEGTLYSAKLTDSEISFVKKGDPNGPEILKTRVAKVIGAEIPISPGDVVSISKSGDTEPVFAFQVTEPNRSHEILVGNMCGDNRPLLNAGRTDDFEFVYDMIPDLPEDQRIVPAPPQIARMGGVGTGPIECWAPRFGMTKDLPQ